MKIPRNIPLKDKLQNLFANLVLVILFISPYFVSDFIPKIIPIDLQEIVDPIINLQNYIPDIFQQIITPNLSLVDYDSFYDVAINAQNNTSFVTDSDIKEMYVFLTKQFQLIKEIRIIVIKAINLCVFFVFTYIYYCLLKTNLLVWIENKTYAVDEKISIFSLLFGFCCSNVAALSLLCGFYFAKIHKKKIDWSLEVTLGSKS